MLRVEEKRRLTNLVRQRVKEKQEVRPFPAAVTQLLAACDDGNTTTKTFEEIIECDAALAGRLLKLANSPLYGCSSEIRSIAHAAAILGIRNLKRLALTVAGGTLFNDGSSEPSTLQRSLWSHSLGCATVARLISRLSGAIAPDERLFNLCLSRCWKTSFL